MFCARRGKNGASALVSSGRHGPYQTPRWGGHTHTQDFEVLFAYETHAHTHLLFCPSLLKGTLLTAQLFLKVVPQQKLLLVLYTAAAFGVARK